jgi:hypothetical protein
MTTLMSRLRPELEPLPPRMHLLPIDSRGYPVPWFVQWLDAHGSRVEWHTPGAVPEFRLMDQQKWVRAVNEARCWVCGDVLDVYKTFVLGPMCGLNRTTSEPACHRECAQWSARNCPFLSRPQMVRRDNDGLMARTIDNVAGEPITRNPGVTLLWTTKRFTIWRDDKGAPLITVGDPTAIEWFAEGRPATRAEVEASVAGGYPFLERLAVDQDAREPDAGAVRALEQQRTRFEALYPRLEGQP